MLWTSCSCLQAVGYHSSMSKNLVWVIALILVAGASFFGGIYYAISGTFVLPKAISTIFARNDFFMGKVMDISSTSITIETSEGGTKNFNLAPGIQPASLCMPQPLSVDAVEAGSEVHVYTHDDKAVQVNIFTAHP